MITTYYDIMLAVSLALTLVYVFMWHRHFDVHITLKFLLVSVTNLGWDMFSRTETLEAALIANRLTYIGGCYLMLNIMLVVFSMCQIHLNRWLRVSLFLLSSGVFAAAMSMGERAFFYKSISFDLVDGVMILTKQYGPMHSVFVAMIFLYFLMSIGALVYCYIRKNQVSRKMLALLFFPVKSYVTPEPKFI